MTALEWLYMEHEQVVIRKLRSLYRQTDYSCYAYSYLLAMPLRSRGVGDSPAEAIIACAKAAGWKG